MNLPIKPPNNFLARPTQEYPHVPHCTCEACLNPRVVPPQKGNKPSDKGILYCVCYLVLKRGQWEARTEYCHGHDASAVRNEFCRALPRGFYLNRNVSITGIAPVVGYFVDDEKKMILSCD